MDKGCDRKEDHEVGCVLWTLCKIAAQVKYKPIVGRCLSNMQEVFLKI